MKSTIYLLMALVPIIGSHWYQDSHVDIDFRERTRDVESEREVKAKTTHTH